MIFVLRRRAKELKINTFSIRTDQSTDEIKSQFVIPECDAYFLIYVKDEKIDFGAYYAEDNMQDLSTVISCLQEGYVMDSILEALPELVEDSDMVIEDIIDRLSNRDEALEEYEELAIIQACDLFPNNNHNHDHDHDQ